MTLELTLSLLWVCSAEVLASDIGPELPQYHLSCYGPTGAANLIDNADVSFAELRMKFLEAGANQAAYVRCLSISSSLRAES
jgi:hypothetical protein